MKSSKLAFVILFTCFTALFADASIGLGLQAQLGNPNNGTADPSNHSNYLIERPQYTLDYNDTTHEANWVSWDLTTDDIGGSGRSSSFFVDTTLPAGFYQVQTTDYSGSGYDRGHMSPSADRSITRADNDVTFFMSNMVPQTPDNNQGVWANFENYCRSLASAGNEILLISGPSGFSGSNLASGVAVPGYTWKIAVIVPLGAGSAIDRITAATRVIAIKIPNISGVRSTPWQNFVTSAAQIEADTGFTFFTALPAATAAALRTVVDGQSAAGAPAIVSQPSPQTTVVGGSATFTVTASGDAPLSYQWLHDDDEIPGATGATLTVSNVQAADVGNYYVVVTNAVASATSNAAALIVTGLPPSITTPPASQTVNAGTTVTLSVTASGSPTLTYQWRKDNVAVSSATNSTLTLANVQAADAGSYAVLVTNSVSSVLSTPASLAVNPAAPEITGQPASKAAAAGSNASFTVTASGTAPLSYVWRKNGAALSDGGVVSGATTATLLLTGISAADSANYDVVVSNALGSVPSSVATLTVNPPPPSAVIWTFGPSTAATADPTSGLNADITGGTLTQGNNNGTTVLLTTTSASSPLSTYSGAFNAGAAARTGALVQTGTATTGSAYFEFTLAPSAGKQLLATGLSFGMRSTSTGPQAYAVFSSRDGFAAPVATGAVPNDGNWHLYNANFTTVTGATGAPVTFRLYGYNGTGNASASTANWRIDDLNLAVNAIFPPPVAPEIVSLTPANGATGVAITSPITVTFNEAVSFTGNWFTLSSALNGPMAATVNGGPTTFTLTPPSTFANTDTITLTINGAQIVDQATGTIHGTTTATTTFTTEAYVAPTPPVVTTQPLTQSVNSGASVSFTVAASGSAPFTYHWRKAGTAITGNASATTATLTLPAVTTDDTGSYDCVVSNVAGSDISQAAALTVLVVPPTIATQPSSQSAVYGGSASFTVSANGTGPFGYQWRKNGAPISGALAATLSLTGVTAADSANYDVVVSNPAGSATSNAATLAVVNGTTAGIYWDFSSASPVSGVPAGVTGGTLTQGNNNGTTALLTTTSVSSGYTGVSGGNNAGAAARIGALNQGTAGSAYFEFTFTAPAGRQLAATGISFGSRSTGTGPQAFAIYSSLDGFASPISTGTLPADSAWHLYTPAFGGATTTAGGTVTFRLYGYGGTGNPAASTANWRIDDLKLFADLLALPAVAPAVTLVSPAANSTDVALNTPVSITFNEAVNVTGAWFSLSSAANGALTAAVSGGPANYTLTPAADFAYGDTITVTVVGAQVTDQATGTLSLPENYTYSFTTMLPPPPVITVPPAPLTVSVGAGASFSVAATGAGPLSYQWRKDGLAITGNSSATTDTLALPVVIMADAGNYDCVVTNAGGSVTSAAAALTVNKVSASIVLGNLSAAYDGTPKSVSVTTTPNGLSVNVTYNGSGTPPVYPGSYAVSATITDANFTGATSGTLVITTTALVRHGFSLNGGLDGSVQVLTPESVTLNGNAWISGDLLVPGTPTIRLNGSPLYAGTVDGPGVATPTNYTITLNGGSVLRHVVRRIDATVMPVVAAPPSPAGTRSVSINLAGQSAGDFTTLRNLTLNSNAGSMAVPPGTYGTLTANGSSTLILGAAGATQPAVYNLQGLTINGSSSVQIVGPVIINLAGSLSLNGPAGAAAHPEWLKLNLSSGSLTLNGNVALHAFVVAPAGTVTINGNSTLTGGIIADRLTINGNGLLEPAAQ